MADPPPSVKENASAHASERDPSSAPQYPLADPPAVEWSRIYGGSSDDGFTAVVATPDGGLAAAGRSSSHDGDAEHNRGGSDGWLVKIGPDGRVQGKRSFGGSENDRIGALATSSDGGFLVAGETETPDGDFREAAEALGIGRPGPAGASEAPSASGNAEPAVGGQGRVPRGRLWAAKLDVELKTVWLVVFGGEGEWTADAVSETADGGIQVLGLGSLSPMPGTAPESADNSHNCRSVGHDRKLLRLETLDPSARRVRSRCYVLPDGLESFGASATPGGGAVLAYAHIKRGGNGESGIARFGDETELMFDRPVPDGGEARPGGAVPLPGGGYAVAGSFMPDGARPFPWLLLTGPDGAVRWQASLDRAGLSGGLADAVPLEGGIFAVGSAESLRNEEFGGRDLLAVRTDPGGKILFTASWGGSGTDSASACAVLADGGLVAAGETNSAEVAPTPANRAGGGNPAFADGLIVKFRP
jgi:hypothetical protein